MKTKNLLTLALSLTTVVVMVNSMEIPSGLADLHLMTYPDFFEKDLNIEIYKLPDAFEYIADNTLNIMACEF